MKFKTIFILFNIVIFVSFLFVVFMPLLIAGSEYSRVFWADNWYLGVFFVVVMLALNAYFFTNRKVFELLETENWSGLITHLEHRIYVNNRGSRQSIRLLLNTYLVTTRFDEIRKLETWLREKRPSLLPVFSLPLGLPYLLRNDPVSMEKYYGEFLSDPRVPGRNWVKFSHAFSLVLQSRLEEAKQPLLALSTSSGEPVLQLVSAYFLSSFFPADDAARNSSESVRSYLRKQYSIQSWKRRVSSMRNNLAVVVLSRLIGEAEEWVFGERSDRGEELPKGV